MKKIVFHIHCLERGGAERVVSNLAGQFVNHGYEVYIATEEQGENEYEIDSKIHRVHVGLTKKQEQNGRILKFVDRIINLRRFLLDVKPDIVIAFARKANYRALTATIGTRIPVVISIRISPVGWYDFPSDKIQIPLLFRRAAGCVFQTQEQKDFFPEYVQERSRIILNAINPVFIGNPIPEKREKAVVHSGRIVDFKNQQMLIRAFEKVHQKHPDYILKIFGQDTHDGTWQKLEALIEQNQAWDYVKLMGGSNQLQKDMINGAVAAFSSDMEGMPNAMLEAMALGLPVVATDCPPGGPRMVITPEENGILVPVGDEDALAKAINRLIENPALADKMGRNAAKIGEKAGADVIFKEWEDYLLEIEKGEGRPGLCVEYVALYQKRGLL